MSSSQSTTGRKRCIFCFTLTIVGVIAIPASIQTANEKKAARKVPQPQYSVTNATLWPNAAAVAGNLLTADFRFTLKAHNPNRKKTIFYGNTTQVTLDCRRFLQITSSSFPLVGPSTLPPGNDSTGIAVNLPVQNWPLPEDTASCGMILTMAFRAGFNQEEEESKRPWVGVRCSIFNFQTKNFTGDYGRCST